MFAKVTKYFLAIHFEKINFVLFLKWKAPAELNVITLLIYFNKSPNILLV